MVQCQRKFEISSDQLTSNYHFLEKGNLNEGFNHFQYKRPLVVSFSHKKTEATKSRVNISRTQARMYPSCKKDANLSNTLRIILNDLAGLQTEMLAINSKYTANKCDGQDQSISELCSS